MENNLYENAPFGGKFVWLTADREHAIALQPNGDKLTISTCDRKKPGTEQQFNIYHIDKSRFLIQAGNNRFVRYDAGYKANGEFGQTDLAIFRSIQQAEQNFIMAEAVGQEIFQLAKGEENILIRTPFVPADDTAMLLTELAITDGLPKMRARRSSMGQSLTGVLLAQQDLTGIAFLGSDLSDADFSATRMDKRNNFNGATAKRARFDCAVFEDWSAAGVDFEDCSFLGATFKRCNFAVSSLNDCLFDGVDFQSCNLQGVDFGGCQLNTCAFNDTLLNKASFKGSKLVNADFSKAIGIQDIVTLEGAVLIATKMPDVDMRAIRLDKDTNFMNALLDGCDFRGKTLSDMVFARASMKKCKLDGAVMDGTQFSFADLSMVTATGGVSMIGANLSNANLADTNFSGAQLGAKRIVSSFPISMMTGLQHADLMNGLTLKHGIAESTSIQPLVEGAIWEVNDGVRSLRLQRVAEKLLVHELQDSSNAAVLSNAYMSNANFSQSNLYSVQLTGVHWYGGNANATGADLALANFSGAFLANMHFDQSLMQGASFDYASLIGTVFKGVNLSPTPAMKPVSFSFSNLQSTVFEETNLYDANLTNAALALEHGVPLFALSAAIKDELDLGKLSKRVTDLFTTNGYPLQPEASIDVIKKGQTWSIGNIAEDNPRQVGYGKFSLRLKKSTSTSIEVIKVYGNPPLIILNADGEGGQVKIPLFFGETGITASQLSKGTTCASGLKFNYLSKYVDYEQLMTAALPPTPPTCLNCWD